MFELLGGVFSFLSGIAPAISSYFTAAKNVEATEFASMTSAERDEYVAYAQAQAALNAAKTQNNATAPAHVMIYLFGVPAALHWGAVFITATFPQLGVAVYPLQGNYGIAEKDIAESFFLLAPTLPLVGALSQRIRG
jgi:hypothetical protein